MTNECRFVWRRSSFSGDGGTGGGNCVETALPPSAQRDSTNPAATVVLPRSGLAALVRHVAG